MKLLKSIILILAIAVAAGSCKMGRDIPKENTLTIHQPADPSSLDPNMGTSAPEGMVTINIFEGLTRYHPETLEPLPGVAERWEISPDGKVYTFYLRKDAKWSDGSFVTAHDFVFSWERMLNPATGAQYAFTLYPIKNAKKYNSGKLSNPKALGFKATDDHTLKVTLENPTAYFLTLTSFKSYFPLPRKAVEMHGAKWTRPENILCNGPFRLVSWTSQKELIAKKNEFYWGNDDVSLDKITFRVIESTDTALKEYSAGNIDIITEVPQLKIVSLKNHPDCIKEDYLSLRHLKVNTTRPPLTDVRVRMALAMAIDRKTLLNTLKMEETPMGNAVPNGIKGYSSPPGIEFNPLEAKKLLAAAGFDGAKDFPPVTIHYNTSENARMIAEIIQRMWKENLGIDVRLLNEEWKIYLKTQAALAFDVSLYGWVGDYIDPNTFLDLYVSESGLSKTGWKNSAFDRLIHKAERTLDAEERMNILGQAEALLLKEVPIIPLAQRSRYLMIKPYVTGYYPTITNEHPLREVRIKK